MSERVPLLYFLDSVDEVPDYALRDGKPVGVKHSITGIDGKIGILVTPCSGIYDLTYDPDVQTWRKVSGIYIGVDKEIKCNPSSLVRQSVQMGHNVSLADGTAWTIPVARLVTGGTCLPSTRVFDQDGKPKWEVHREFQDLEVFASKIWLAKTGEPTSLTDDELDECCGKALSVNYRIGMNEAICLNLFSNVAMKAIVEAIVDWPTVQVVLDSEKKK